MHKQVGGQCGGQGRGGQAVQKKLQDARRGLGLEVEGAVNKLEAPSAALVEPVQLGQKRLERKGPGGFVERAQAKLALKRAATRGLNVQHAVRQVGVAVLGIGQGNLVERRLLPSNHLHQRRGAVQQGAAQLWKADITPAGDHMVGQRHDGLLVMLMADLGATQHQLERGARCLEQAQQRTGLTHIPDVDTKADHLPPAYLCRPQQGQQLGG